jgi:diguanylate cyclase
MANLSLSPQFLRAEFEIRYGAGNALRLAEIHHQVAAAAADLASGFEATLLADPRAAAYLAQGRLSPALRQKLAEWLLSLFEAKQGEALDAFLERQREIGAVHARLGIPFDLLEFAALHLKVAVRNLLVQSAGQRLDAGTALLVDDLLGASLALSRVAFFTHSIAHERATQAIRTRSSDMALAYECERLRSSLLDWFRQLLTALHQGDIRYGQLPSVRHTDLFLWLTHKGRLLFPEHMEIQGLDGLLAEMDQGVRAALDLHTAGKWPEHAEKIAGLNGQITEAAWLLTSLAQSVMDFESKRDTLTHLLNRRDLPCVLKYLAANSLQQGVSFAIFFVDIDHFKRINDIRGHEVGDLVLAEVANLLLGMVRAGDYVFRYGGEEFLVVVPSIVEPFALTMAENMRQRLEEHEFRTVEPPLRIAVSIGVALSAADLDYDKVVKRADQAVLRAKREGRNRICLAS